MRRFPLPGRPWVWTLVLAAAVAMSADVARAQGSETEANDTAASANVIPTDGSVWSNALGTGTDVDFFQFVATAGETYTITTSNLGVDVDTGLELFDIDPDPGGIAPVSDSFGTGGAGSQIVYTAVSAVTHYVRVYGFVQNAGVYDLSVSAGGAPVVPDLNVFGVSVLEGNDEFTPVFAAVSVELSEPTTVPVTFDVSLTPVTATDGDTDYLELATPSVSIPAGDASYVINVTIVADAIAESVETFDVSLLNVDGANPVTTTATVTIENDDLLQVLIESDANADGSPDAGGPVYIVNEFNDPNSTISFDVLGGVGPSYTLSIVSTPSLGKLIDPNGSVEMFAGESRAISEGGLLLEFAGTPQSSGSFEPSDAFIITVTDDGDASLTSGSVIVELSINDVNQSVVVDREGLAFVASGSVVNLPIVDLTDIDFDEIPDPSIYDPDGDSLAFANPVSSLGAEVWVAGSSLRYEAPIYNDVASAGGPLTDTVTVEVSDNSGAPAPPSRRACP